MKIKVEALVELTVEVPEKCDTDDIVKETKKQLRRIFKNTVDAGEEFKIIIIGKE